MSKYEFPEIQFIDNNTTHGKVLSCVTPGSKVLECGCASGYMTKYMHEKMGCTVDVLDINYADLKKAKQYANDAFMSDLNREYWYESIDGNKYDFILFADVIEHLRDPMRVLKDAIHLLKDDGKIIVSIPNICHNDILIRMYYDIFTYSDTGLLDSTHIHFWGIKNFVMECHEIGLNPEKCDCICRQTGTTEQRMDLADVDQEFLSCLKKRDLGEIYQFVFTCSKK